MRLTGAVLDAVTEWLPTDDEPDRPQIQLATVDAAGRPDVRTVLLSGWTPDGFSFHTDTTSRKAEQLEQQPAVAIVAVWPGFSRQLVILGVAEREEPATSRVAFARRSPYLQQLAWQNSHEFALLPYADRIEQWRAFRAEHAAEPMPVSPTWSGYVVRPDRLTFWESDPDTASHRLEYTAVAGDWVLTHLPG